MWNTDVELIKVSKAEMNFYVKLLKENTDSIIGIGECIFCLFVFVFFWTIAMLILCLNVRTSVKVSKYVIEKKALGERFIIHYN